MRILFVASRFHTNQFEIVKLLKEKRNLIFFHVNHIGSTEDHSFCKPQVFRPCFVSRRIKRLFQKNCRDTFFDFPNPLNYFKILKNEKIDIAIIRNPYWLFSLLAAGFCKILKIKIIFYS